MDLPAANTAVTIYPAPADEPLSQDYTVTVNDSPVPVYVCRVSAVPLNQTWPGYQRPLEQTELASFAYWDSAGPITVKVTAPGRPITSVIIRPLGKKVVHTIANGVIKFDLPGPGQFTVEVNGWHNALHLFINPPEVAAPTVSTPNLLYFGPGVHNPGRINLESNQTVYIAGGAVVYGCFVVKNAENVKIYGRGIIDVSWFVRPAQGGYPLGAIQLYDCSNVILEGPILRDPAIWCCRLFGCQNAILNNLKLVGLWRYNTDGIDICNCQNVYIRDCFVRSFDDSIAFKGIKWGGEISYHTRPVHNVVVERCVLWNDWGRALEIGAETSAPEIAHIVFRDCDIIRTKHTAIDIQHGDRATVRDLRFENIRVEADDFNLRPQFQTTPNQQYVLNPQDTYRPTLLNISINKNAWSSDETVGVVRNILFKDITVTSKLYMASAFRGAGSKSNVSGVTIENLRVNSRQRTGLVNAGISVGPFVSGVTYRII